MTYTVPPNPMNQAIQNITVGASPFNWQNTNAYPVVVAIAGGVLGGISYSRDGSAWNPAGGSAQLVHLNPGDWVQITYTLIPTSMKAIPTSA